MERREYPIDIVINSRRIQAVIIDTHYEIRHRNTINDELILQLVRMLDGGIFPVQDKNTPYEYFVTDRMELDGKIYKLVWLLEDDHLYIGIVNAYRRK